MCPKRKMMLLKMVLTGSCILGNQKQILGHQGPVFPISFFNLGEDSAASNSALQQFSFNPIAEPRWLWKKGEARREKKNLTESNRAKDENNANNEKRNVSEVLHNEGLLEEQLVNKKDKAANKEKRNSTNSKNSSHERNDFHEDNTEDMPTEEYLPFLGEIDENTEPGKKYLKSSKYH